MNINAEQIGDIDLVSISGRLAFDVSPEFDAGLRELVNEAERNKVILDFAGVTFISSPVLRSILTLAKRLRRHQGSLYVTGASEEVIEVFRVSGFIGLGVFQLGARDEAIRALKAMPGTVVASEPAISPARASAAAPPLPFASKIQPEESGALGAEAAKAEAAKAEAAKAEAAKAEAAKAEAAKAEVAKAEAAKAEAAKAEAAKAEAAKAEAAKAEAAKAEAAKAEAAKAEAAKAEAAKAEAAKAEAAKAEAAKAEAAKAEAAKAEAAKAEAAKAVAAKAEAAKAEAAKAEAAKAVAAKAEEAKAEAAKAEAAKAEEAKAEEAKAEAEKAEAAKVEAANVEAARGEAAKAEAAKVKAKASKSDEQVVQPKEPILSEESSQGLLSSVAYAIRYWLGRERQDDSVDLEHSAAASDEKPEGEIIDEIQRAAEGGILYQIKEALHYWISKISHRKKG